MTMSGPDAAAIADGLARLRARRPRVHCITNSVAGNFTANVLLAAGAIPSMTINPEEMPDFIASADALLVNLGTLDPLCIEAIDVALGVASETGKPWVLDPVFVERSSPRLALARRLVTSRPTLIRSNQAELIAMTGGAGDGDDRDADTFALTSGAVVVRTGETDYITDGTNQLTVAGGHSHLTRVTAAGCAATALMAGFLAVHDDAVVGSAICLAMVAVAAEIAGEKTAGPGSFATAFIDSLYQLTPEQVANQARIS